MARIVPSPEEEERTRVAAAQDAVRVNNEQAIAERPVERRHRESGLRLAKWALLAAALSLLVSGASLWVAVDRADPPVAPPPLEQVAPVPPR